MSIRIALAACAVASLLAIGCTNEKTTSSESASTGKVNVEGPRKAIAGTWQGRDAQGSSAATQHAGFQFASVSFVNDGTFTAQMRYNGQLVADSGTWTLAGNTLTVNGSAGSGGAAGAHGTSAAGATGTAAQGTDGSDHAGHSAAGGRPAHHVGPRTYTIQTRGNELMITDPQTRVTVTLDRMRGRP